MNPPVQQESLAALLAERNRLHEHSSRLEFLYRIVADAQETIRFLDTKAGFCVTLLTAMMAAAFGPLARTSHHGQLHTIALGVFAVATLLTLAMCLRVIFPTIHLQGTFSATGSASPAFFLPHGARKPLQSVWTSNSYPLGVTHDDYTASVIAAGDMDLIRSMCDEVVIVSAIRQLKSDRLHAAILGLSLVIGFFFVQLML